MENRTHFIVAVGQFINTNEALFTIESFDVLTHEQNAGDAEESVIDQWNEDGVMADFTFSVDNTKNVVINSLAVSLVASDGTNTFELDRLDVSLTPNSGFPPVLNVASERGYTLPTGSEFNLISIVDGGTMGSKTFYDAVIGQKITWQEWLSNINVPPAFIDLAQLNNGQNQKADNYSGVNGYEIHLKISANITGDDSVQGTITEDIEQLSSVVNVYDYFESDDGVIIDGIIETFDSTGTYNLGGTFLENADTLFKVTWVGAAALDVADVGYIIHRIEREFAPSNNEIEEISTLRGAVTGGKLENIAFIQSGVDIVSTCTIKAGALSAGNWKLSARIKMPPAPTAFGWLLLHLTNPSGKSVTFTARNDIFSGSKTFYSVNSATVSGDYTFRIGDTSANLTDANDAGWAAFSDLTFAAFTAASIPINTKVRVTYTGAATDTDILTAIKVSMDEGVIATVTNTVYPAASSCMFDVLLPFQTDHSVNIVSTTNTTNSFSEVRTDAEISAGTDLTDFVNGIAPLLNCGLDASGHLQTDPSGNKSIGANLNIQSTASVGADGAVSGIASPIQNLYFPANGTGVNPPAINFDKINDSYYAADTPFNDFINMYNLASGTERSFVFRFRGYGGDQRQYLFTAGSLGNEFNDGFFGGSIMSWTGSGRYQFGFGDLNITDKVYTVVWNVKRPPSFNGDTNDLENYIEGYVNSRRYTNIAFKQFNLSADTFINNALGYNYDGGGIGPARQVNSLEFFAVNDAYLTPKEVREISLSPLADIKTSFSFPYMWDFSQIVSTNQVPHIGTTAGAPNLVLSNHTNLVGNLF